MMRKLMLLGSILLVCAFTNDNKSYVLDDILFDPNSSELTDNQIQELKVVIKTIRASLAEGGHRTFTLWINGNSDSSEDNTRRLAIKRSKNVKEQLLNLGLTEGRLIPKGHGTKRPLTDSSADDKRRRNARVDFQITLE
jgi:OmpA-OmpF porin, OOP family